jgi:hypothetical protein
MRATAIAMLINVQRNMDIAHTRHQRPPDAADHRPVYADG